MPQTRWERGFWASVRDKDNILPSGKEFKPFSPDHWYKPKKKRVKKGHKKAVARQRVEKDGQLGFIF